jgi:hypothetical protein
MLALFELIPRVDTTGKDTVASVQIDFCLPGKKTVQHLDYYCPQKIIPFDRAQNDLRREICIAMLGMKLRDNAGTAMITWPELEKMAKKNFPGTGFMDKEFTDLLAKAKKVYRAGN